MARGDGRFGVVLVTRARTHTPLPDLVVVGLGKLRQVFGISGVAIRRLVMRGIVVQVEHGGYDLLASTTNYLRHLRRQAAGHVGHKGGDVVTAAAGLKQSQQRLTDLRIAQIEGKLIDREAVVELWAALVRQDKQLFLSFPGRARFDLPHLSGSDQERMTRIAHEMLSELAVTGEVPPLPPAS
jgi:phage terminase Nu1 subunit (DNA packaging protein)